MDSTSTRLIPLGDGLAVRLTEEMARAAGVSSGTWALLSISPGRIVIETRTSLSMDQVLRAFDPVRYGGELMADEPCGVEFASRSANFQTPS